jgi:RNA polymerase sigma-70 factor (ECF subfamily)
VTAVTVPLDVGAPHPPLDLEALYRESRDDVYAYALTIVRDAPAAEDVTAQAFERAMRRRRLYAPRRGTPRAWLFGIARNAALDELRRRGRHAELTSDPPDRAAEDQEELATLRIDLRRALAELAPRERELVALRFHAGLTHAEVARVLGISESNAQTLLHRTIQKLRSACHVPA